jgi:ribosomal protein S18 acetylase RimI-like enzyme
VIDRPPGKATLRFVTTDDPAYRGELELRFRVLREPLGRTRTDVRFPFERESLHLVAEQNGRVTGCVLFHHESSTGGRLLQMAVSADRWRHGLGRALVATMEVELRRRGVADVHLHARADVVGFYERLGYAIEGEPFVEVGIAHRRMRKTL